jgi:ABC-type enterochelin transport system substrate-binding protein
MPLTAKGEKIMANMQREYGAKKGESVFYASRNSGRISGVDPQSRRSRVADALGKMRSAGRK